MLVNQYQKEKDLSIFLNGAAQKLFEPGSVLKPITMAAGLEMGVITPETTYTDPGSIKVGSYVIYNYHQQKYGEKTMTEVLENSDNVAMVWLSQQIGEESFYEYLKNFGFGAKTGIDLETESEGKLLELKQWRPIHLATISFGQGIAVTPIQIISSYIAIANKGEFLQPYIVDKIVEPSGKVIQREPKKIRRIIKEETAKTITEMMVSVVKKGHGKKAGVEGYQIAGKTGTAQIPDPEKAGYLEGINIGSFAGFAPANDPKFVMLVKIDKPKNMEWAEASAAPVFGEIAEWLLNYFEIPKQS